MTAVLRDTHARVWSLNGDDRLSEAALATISAAESVFVSPITFFEIAQKARIGKSPEMEPFVGRLTEFLRDRGGLVASLDPSICVAAGMMAWAHRNPFDRLLAATAAHYRLPLISADGVFDGVVARVW